MSITIKTTYQKDEPLGENFKQDAIWIGEHRQALYEEYGACVLLVYYGEVIGYGDDVSQAVANAEEHLQDKDGVITPVVKYMSSPYRIGILRRT